MNEDLQESSPLGFIHTADPSNGRKLYDFFRNPEGVDCHLNFLSLIRAAAEASPEYGVHVSPIVAALADDQQQIVDDVLRSGEIAFNEIVADAEKLEVLEKMLVNPVAVEHLHCAVAARELEQSPAFLPELQIKPEVMPVDAAVKEQEPQKLAVVRPDAPRRSRYRDYAAIGLAMASMVLVFFQLNRGREVERQLRDQGDKQQQTIAKLQDEVTKHNIRNDELQPTVARLEREITVLSVMAKFNRDFSEHLAAGLQSDAKQQHNYHLAKYDQFRNGAQQMQQAFRRHRTNSDTPFDDVVYFIGKQLVGKVQQFTLRDSHSGLDLSRHGIENQLARTAVRNLNYIASSGNFAPHAGGGTVAVELDAQDERRGKLIVSTADGQAPMILSFALPNPPKSLQDLQKSFETNDSAVPRFDRETNTTTVTFAAGQPEATITICGDETSIGKLGQNSGLATIDFEIRVEQSDAGSPPTIAISTGGESIVPTGLSPQSYTNQWQQFSIPVRTEDVKQWKELLTVTLSGSAGQGEVRVALRNVYFQMQSSPTTVPVEDEEREAEPNQSAQETKQT